MDVLHVCGPTIKSRIGGSPLLVVNDEFFRMLRVLGSPFFTFFNPLENAVH